jgi:hypothetical protein
LPSTFSYIRQTGLPLLGGPKSNGALVSLTYEAFCLTGSSDGSIIVFKTFFVFRHASPDFEYEEFLEREVRRGFEKREEAEE